MSGTSDSVAEKVLDHLRTMYPDALKAVPASASISIRNFTAAAVNSAIMAAKADCLPKLENTGTYLAKDNTGQWHYINHARTWQGCPDPFHAAKAEGVTQEREACAAYHDDMAAKHQFPSGVAEGSAAVFHDAMVGFHRAFAAAIRKRGE